MRIPGQLLCVAPDQDLLVAIHFDGIKVGHRQHLLLIGQSWKRRAKRIILNGNA